MIVIPIMCALFVAVFIAGFFVHPPSRTRRTYLDFTRDQYLNDNITLEAFEVRVGEQLASGWADKEIPYDQPRPRSTGGTVFL